MIVVDLPVAKMCSYGLLRSVVFFNTACRDRPGGLGDREFLPTARRPGRTRQGGASPQLLMAFSSKDPRPGWESGSSVLDLGGQAGGWHLRCPTYAPGLPCQQLQPVVRCLAVSAAAGCSAPRTSRQPRRDDACRAPLCAILHVLYLSHFL